MKIPRKVCTEEELKCFGKDPMGFVLKLHEEFSDIVEVEMGSTLYVFPFKPEYIKQIIEEKHVGRTSFSNLFEPIAGGSLILSEGDEWREKRMMLAPFFISL